MLKQKIARIISEIFSGFFTMMLVPVITLYHSSLGTFSKLVFSLAYILTPMLPYFVLKAFGKVSDYELTNRKERPPFFTTISILYGLIFLLSLMYQDTLIQTVFFNIFLVSTIITVITYFWKISGHLTYFTLFSVTLIYLFPNNPYLFLLFLFAPLVGWSRIVLEKHTLTQTVVGTFLTLLISVLIYWPFC